MSATYLPPEQQPEAGPTELEARAAELHTEAIHQAWHNQGAIPMGAPLCAICAEREQERLANEFNRPRLPNGPLEEPQAATDRPEAPLPSQDAAPVPQQATPAPAAQPVGPAQAQWDQPRAWQQPPSMSPSWQPTVYGTPPYPPQQTYLPPYAPPQPPKSPKGLRAAIFTVIGLVVVIGVAVAAVTLSGGGSAAASAATQWHTWVESGGRAALSRYTSDFRSWDDATYCATTKVVAQSLVDDTQAVLAVTSPLPESVSSPLQSWANHSRGAFQADIAYCSTSTRVERRVRDRVDLPLRAQRCERVPDRAAEHTPRGRSPRGRPGAPAEQQRHRQRNCLTPRTSSGRGLYRQSPTS